MYTFEDRGGRSLTLRPEGTAPVVRAFVEHGMHKLPLPVRLWYLAPMFRYEAPQAGRYREHWQVGIEAIGSDDPLVDVEVIEVLADLYARLGLTNLRLRLSSMGDPEARGPYRERLVDYLRPHERELADEERERLRDNPLRLFDAKRDRTREIMAGAPKLVDNLTPEARAHHERVKEGLSVLGIGWEDDPMLVRGFDYYTRTVFEFESPRLGAQSAVGGGGRYDGLVAELGGPPTPGVGFGAGVERIVLALGEAEPEPALDAYWAVPDPALRAELLPVLASLRAAGLRVESGTGERKLRAMLRQAASAGAPRAVIVGPRDHEAGVATVRDMRTGDQTTVPLGSLADVLSGDGGPA
jgi:histidyl-tRNA synthetase